jgi:hypothetical protein
MSAKTKLKDIREQMIEAIEWIKSTPNGVVRFRTESKKELKEILDLVDELVEEDLKSRIEIN